jgi:hypothetical protein
MPLLVRGWSVWRLYQQRYWHQLEKLREFAAQRGEPLAKLWWRGCYQIRRYLGGLGCESEAYRYEHTDIEASVKASVESVLAHGRRT